MKMKIPHDEKAEMACIVRHFDLTNSDFGNCGLRARIGYEVLTRCGCKPRIAWGSMLFRAGKHRTRDTLRFALPNNQGGYCRDHVIGHCWNEIDGDIVDFSLGDWPDDAAAMYASSLDREDVALGPLEWKVETPEFIWQDARPLKAAWQRKGQPTIGELWYGPWSASLPEPSLGHLDPIIDQVRAHLDDLLC